MQSSQQTWMDSAINFLDLLNDNNYTSRILFQITKPYKCMF